MAPKKSWNVDSNWHFAVFAAPDVAAWLFTGRERELLNWFFGHEGHGGNGTVDPGDLDQYVRALSRPGALRAGAQYYAAIFQDGDDNAPLKDQPLTMPVLAVGGASHAGPMLKRLWGLVASQLETAIIPAAGHWLAEENPAVRMAAVVGLPDDYWGEAVAAAIVVDPTSEVSAEAIIAHVKARKGAIYAPKHVRILKELPTTALGKIDKVTLRTDLLASIIS